jgi:hypothetical protein
VSQRTIVEFNHDYTHDIEEDGAEFVRALRMALGSGAREPWRQLERFGLRKAVQCHHSDNRYAVVNRHTYTFPGDGEPDTGLTEFDMKRILEDKGYRVTKMRKPKLETVS